MKKLLVMVLSVILLSLLISGCEKSPASESSLNGSLIISPVSATESAEQMEDTALISLLERELYKNGMVIVGDWICGGSGLDLDYDTSYEVDNLAIEYVLVKNIQTMQALKTNCEAIFSKEFLSSYVYPILIEGEYPLFAENNQKLYYNKNTGGGYSFAPEFTRANVTSKSTDIFEIEVPMTTADDQEGKIFIYKAVKQNGNWVLDSYHYFQQ